MKRILCMLFALILPIFGAHADSTDACILGHFAVDGVCHESKFRVTTTDLKANTTFRFAMSAKGTFYIDWGDGNTQTITRTNTYDTRYSHTYTDAGTYVIQFGGESATGAAYKTSAGTVGVLSFFNGNSFNGTPGLVGEISGSLGALFPTRGENEGYQPRFLRTFSGCFNLTGIIPENLFSGVYGKPVSSMFENTFSGCRGLTVQIPSGLFSGISGAPASNMFTSTFQGCSGLIGKIPSDLFSGISGAPASSMFEYVFNGCSGLTGTIPEDLFAGISGSPASRMFFGAFQDCSGLTGSIPSGLFSGISGAPAESMFNGTFNRCSGLTGSIPSGLFSGISGTPAESMFNGTFNGCSNLTGSIPSGLFSGISGAPAESMFTSTFKDCSNLTGSIPPGLFGNLSGAPASGMFSSTFRDCSGLTGSIPSGLFGNLLGAPASSMFNYTFKGCSGLTGSIPSGLFGNLTGSLSANQYYFNSMFSNCSKLSGYVPADLFSGLSYADPASTGGIMNSIFNGTNLATSCPCGTTQYITRFEDKWDGAVACETGVKPNEHWNNGICTTDCDAGFNTLKTDTGLSFPVLSDRTSDLSFVFEHNGETCYLPTKPGNGNLNIMLDGSKAIHHAVEPDGIVPDGFMGQ